MRASTCHIGLNAEALRPRWVAHEGQQQISVRRDGFIAGSESNDWPGVFAEFSDRLAESIGKKRDLVVAKFSTTGPIEAAVSQVALMSALRKYFEYTVMRMCGIPSITLHGTVDDWKSVRRRAEVLGEFDLAPWMNVLLPVLDQFVRASEGHIDTAFWQSLYKKNTASGGPYVTGWVNTLFPYIEQRYLDAGNLAQRTAWNPYLATWEKGLSSPHGGGPVHEEIPKGLSVAPFIWEIVGHKTQMEFVAGFVGVSQDPQSYAVRPAMGWAVRSA